MGFFYMTCRKYKIGVFDSGYGGLSIFKEIQKALPDYEYIYMGDNARTPYGTRSFETVYKYTLEAVKKLFELDCYLIIIACNTASAKALRNIQQKDLPHLYPSRRILGIIRPSTEAIVEYTKSQNVGILGTNGTVNSNSYPIEIHKLHPQIKVFQQSCPMWVPLVENNEYEDEGADYFVKKYIDELLQQEKNIDTIVLGCTHYPLLYNKIRKYIPKEIEIINQGEIVANSLSDYLKRHPEIEERCSKNSNTTFYTTDSAEMFNKMGSLFLATPINSEKLSF